MKLRNILLSGTLVQICLSAALLIAAPTHKPENEPEFVILVPSYNNEKYVHRNLDSLIRQNTKARYSILYVNDCSSDKTGALVDSYAQEHNLKDSFFKIIHNKKRVGALANIYNTIHTHCKDDQIVVLVDGDDFAAHPNVLARLEKEYTDPNIWLTYGQFIFYPSGKWGMAYEIHRDTLMQKKLRSLRIYTAQHLRTFKAGLFKKIKKEDLMLNGEFFMMNADMAIMIPMLEMCAPQDAHSPSHCKFIPDILYMYNYENPLNDCRADQQNQSGATQWPTTHQSKLQIELEKVIRALPPYDPVESLN